MLAEHLEKCLAYSKFLSSISCSVVSDSLRPHGLEPTRFLCPWNSPGKNTEVGSHSLLQGIFLTQGLNLGLLLCRWILYWLSHRHMLTKYKPVNDEESMGRYVVRLLWKRRTAQSLETVKLNFDSTTFSLWRLGPVSFFHLKNKLSMLLGSPLKRKPNSMMIRHLDPLI